MKHTLTICLAALLLAGAFHPTDAIDASELLTKKVTCINQHNRREKS